MPQLIIDLAANPGRQLYEYILDGYDPRVPQCPLADGFTVPKFPQALTIRQSPRRIGFRPSS